MAAAAAADAAAVSAPYHRRHRLLRTAAVVQLPVPMPAGHLYNKRGVGPIPGVSGGNNNVNSAHIGSGGGILHAGTKGQRQPFLQRLPSRIHHLTRAIEMAVWGTANPTQQQQQQHQHTQAKTLKSKPNNNRQAGSKKLQQSEKT